MATVFKWERDCVLLEGKPPYHPRDLSALPRDNRKFISRVAFMAVSTEWSLAGIAVNVGILLRPWEEVAAVL